MYFLSKKGTEIFDFLYFFKAYFHSFLLPCHLDLSSYRSVDAMKLGHTLDSWNFRSLAILPLIADRLHKISLPGTTFLHFAYYGSLISDIICTVHSSCSG